jgi:peptidoglycan/LPS O-acetylase OafA/YrhL
VQILPLTIPEISLEKVRLTVSHTFAFGIDFTVGSSVSTYAILRLPLWTDRSNRRSWACPKFKSRLVRRNSISDFCILVFHPKRFLKRLMRDQPEISAHPPAHMRCLDGLRGLAALIVVLGHAKDYQLNSIVVSQSRDFGVLVFFVLSGFLMGYLYLDKDPNTQNITDYLSSRTSRIVPLYYFVLISSFAYYQFDQNFVYGLPIIKFIRCLTFTGSVSVFWSLAPEFQFYFLFIPLWICFRYLDNNIIFVTGLILLSLFSLITIKHWPGIIVFSKLHVFAYGIVLSMVKVRGLINLRPATRRYAQLIGIVLLASFLLSKNVFYLFGYMSPNPSDKTLAYFYSSLPHLLLAGYLVFIFSYDDVVGKIFFGNSFAVFLGKISFSVYLLHDVVFYFLKKFGIFVSMGPSFGLLISIGLVIMFSTLTYIFIEVPSRKKLKNILMNKYKLIAVIGNSGNLKS